MARKERTKTHELSSFSWEEGSRRCLGSQRKAVEGEGKIPRRDKKDVDP